MEQTFICELCHQATPSEDRCLDETIFAAGWVICASCEPRLRQALRQGLRQAFRQRANRQPPSQRVAVSPRARINEQGAVPQLRRLRTANRLQNESEWTFPHIIGSDYQPARRSRARIDSYTASYIRWQSKAHVVSWLASFDHPQALPPVFLGTEATGIGSFSEIIEVCIVDANGQTLFYSLINPTAEIDPIASAIHGLTRQDVKDAPRYPDIHEEVMRPLHNHVVIAYNVSFDMRLLKQTADC